MRAPALRCMAACAGLLVTAGCGDADGDVFPPSGVDAGARFGDAGTSAFDVGAPPFPEGDAAAACDPISGGGCASPLFVCRLNNGPTCVRGPAVGRGRGEVCAPGDCAAGLACINGAATSTAADLPVCLEVCRFESGEGCDEVDGDYECRLQIEGEPGFGACIALPPRCNPYTQRPCLVSESCVPFLRRTGTREMRCQEPGPGQRGEPCGSRVGNCRRGLVCVAGADGPASAVCRQYCELNADCPSPEQCTGRADDPGFTFCLP